LKKGLLNIPEKPQGDDVLPEEDMLRQLGIEGEDRKILEQYLGNGMQMIHGRETRDQVLGRLRKDDPEQSLADTVSVVINSLDASASGAGMDVPDMVRFIAGMSLLSQVAEVAEAAGIAQFDDDARVLAFSQLLASQLDKGIRSGKYNPKELKQAAQQAADKLKLDPAAGVEKITQGASHGL
jgi:hypothetical protein